MALSRRTFSALAGTAALGFALGGSGGPGASSAYAAREVPTGPPPAPPRADGRRHSVEFDRHSLVVDGRRLVLWSGEMHPFRLPSPSLWRDVLQKLRAHGHNAVSVPVAWNHHSPAPGRYDFTGVRDLDLFLRTAAETGLYVVLRPGPYIGADVDGGGLPGWLRAAPGTTARTADPAYLAHVDEWLGAVDAVAVRHLFTSGRGTVLLYRLEDGADVRVNEPAGRAYLAHLYGRLRADGIDVPLFHAGADRGRTWIPGFSGADAGKGPGLLAVRGAGAADPWGGARFGGKGYAEARRTHDAAYERRTGLTRLAQGVTVHETGPAFGGTSWGWLPAPDVYTSYDHGAAVDEARRPTGKLAAAHQIGHMLRTFPDFPKLEPAGHVEVAGLTTHHLTNPDTGAHVHVLRNDGDRDVASTMRLAGHELPVTVPAGDAQLAVTHLTLGRRKVRYSTAQPMLWTRAGRQDVAVFVGRPGELAHLALDCAEEPLVTRLDAEAAFVYDLGVLRVTAPFGERGLIRVLVEGDGEDRPLLLLFADDATSLRLWPYDTPSGSLLVYSPAAMLRTAELRGSTVHLTGDTLGVGRMEVWAPRGIDRVTWNGSKVPATPSTSTSLLSDGPLPGAPDTPGVSLPALGDWRMRVENPESGPGFDDSAWRAAGGTAPDGAAPPSGGQPVPSADDHGFPYGDVWYRGTFTDASGVEAVSLSYRTGTQGLLMAWLDGDPLGTHRMPVPDGRTLDRNTWTDTAAFPVGERLRTPGRHVLSVLVRPMAHAQDGPAEVPRRAARGLTSVAFTGAAPKVSWRIQGATAPDPVRGPLNNGGLYGEREGWHLPGFPDRDWESVRLPRAERRQGVTWYRTTFALAVPADTDASVGLVLDDEPHRSYRVQIFLNGWNMGQYINDVGPQHTFVLPNGILRTRGTNTLALAVLSELGTLSGPGRVRLELLDAVTGGVPVTPVPSPGR
ncbi:beta-galactosidase [Streptomyces sp. NPDC046831]|uniref:beta-galactosidase n=1 Tax=Streptomyces sp. NPDC046831 TaxID=3154805 RepID=UPI0033DB34DA